ncbi:MAG: thiamine pyrophosphate-binding protein [Armatimonadota bacterium]|nr:thiamine pyrophosphate-binding protein [Armatimonadota bacterium]MDW8156144.1 thiamine pyrophosphate-binding protein [Armatimonadota bacterium]
MRKFVSDLIVDLLQRFEIPYVSLNPGSSFRGLHDSLVNYGGNRPEIVECPHEKIAVGIAHGYARVTRRPMATVLHNVVGLLHGSMGIYQAFLDRVPVLVLGATGPADVALRRPRIDWDHTALLQGQAVRDFVKWDDQPVGVEALVESFARAYRVACTEPAGPVYLCYDVAFQEEALTRDVPLPDPTRAAYTRLSAEPGAVEVASEWLTSARKPVIVADLLGRHPEMVAALAELAELLAAPVVDAGGRLNLPNVHPLWRRSREVVRGADCVLLLDVRDSFGWLHDYDERERKAQRLVSEGCRVVEVGFGDLGIRAWSHQFQRYQEADLSILADTRDAVPALVEACRDRIRRRGDAEDRRVRLSALAEEHAQMRARWREVAQSAPPKAPMATARFAWEVWQQIRDRDFVFTGSLVNDWVLRLWEFDRPDRYSGKPLGTATQIGISLGVGLAYRGSGRLVVNVQTDGDLMYDLGALWVASHFRIPMLTVMFNNRAYYNDWEHQIEVARHRGRDEANAYVGMELDHPPPDFAAVARALGWYAEGPLEDAREIGPAVRRALEAVDNGTPALVDCVTAFR